MFEPPDDVVAFIADYMNETHQDALAEIAVAHGASARSARIVGMSGAVLTLAVIDAGGARQDVDIPWPAPLSAREDIRRHLQEMQEEARFGRS
ncbi:DUF2470 domain-containing protein [Microbacterium atlanticum]|uniref:DUF2470 domain-containing protein n=1 Tax=Microbacterium atlanticum TaxID=2782168 RepID=UPI001886B543|nr:DUF2470 domain-containing protein [Microbacterium atlanticum]